MALAGVAIRVRTASSKELLAKLVERGKMSISGAREVRDLARKLSRNQREQKSLQKGGVP